MSESNNNTPMRITQLQEAGTFDYDSYLAAAKAGTGTKKVKGSTLLAELIDARQGADGTTYPSAGDAVRTQYEELKKYIFSSAFVGNEFIVQAGEGHTSTNDNIPLDILASEKYMVVTNIGNIVIQYKDGTTDTKSGLEYFGVASKDIKGIGIYYSNSTNNDVKIKFGIAKNPLGADLYNSLNIIDDNIFKVPTNQNVLIYDDGHTINHSQYSATDYIAITPPISIKFDANIPNGFHALLFYDEDFNVIDTFFTNGARQNVTTTVTNSEIAYMRYQSRNLNFSGNLIEPLCYVFANISDKINKLDKNIKLTKTGSSSFNIKVPCLSGNVVRYDFTRDYKKWDSLEYLDAGGETQTATNIISCDYWNNYYIYNDTTGDYIAQGNNNFIIAKDHHFCGNGHGNEVILTFDIIADGKKINIDDLAISTEITCNELRLIYKTKMFKVGGNTGGDDPQRAYPALDTSGNPIVDFIHCMEISYNIGNKIIMDNKLIVKNNNIVFSNCFGAMLECNFGDFASVIVNNDENTQNNISSDGTITIADGSTINLGNKNNIFANIVEMFGANFYIRQTMKNNDVLQRNKQAVSFVFYDNRLKCYFVPVPTTQRYPSGYDAETFNAGDIIAVSNERIIEI